jgi:3'-5' exoribonuclease
MFREALMLHYLDDLDSKMAAVRAALDSDKGEGNWTAFSGALQRRFLRVDLFRREQEVAAQNNLSQPPALNSLGVKE